MRAELRALLSLAFPLALGHVGQQIIGVTNSAIAGRLGAEPLGAVGLGNSIFFGVTVLGIGLMLSLDPLVSQAVGASEGTRASSIFWQGAWLAVLATIPLTLVVIAITIGLRASDLAPCTVSLTNEYVYARLPTILPLLLSVGTRSYLQSHGVTRPWFVAVVLGNLVNVPLSWMLILGDGGLETIGLPALGLPAHGAAGAGWAATLATFTQCAVMLYAAGSSVGAAVGRLVRPNWRILAQALGIGMPIALTLLAEVGVFTLVSFLMGYIGPRSLAAHNVAISLASLTFQLGIALGSAAAVRVGQAVGAGDGARALRAGNAALLLGAAYTVITGLLFIVAARPLARLITTDPTVIDAAVGLIHVAAAFQLADGLQVVAAGALRGAGDTLYALLANVVGHYGLGLPVGLTLAFGLGWRGEGLWWGLSVGLSVVAVLLVRRFRRVASCALARV